MPLATLRYNLSSKFQRCLTTTTTFYLNILSKNLSRKSSKWTCSRALITIDRIGIHKESFISFDADWLLLVTCGIVAATLTLTALTWTCFNCWVVFLMKVLLTSVYWDQWAQTTPITVVCNLYLNLDVRWGASHSRFSCMFVIYIWWLMTLICMRVHPIIFIICMVFKNHISWNWDDVTFGCDFALWLNLLILAFDWKRSLVCIEKIGRICCKDELTN